MTKLEGPPSQALSHDWFLRLQRDAAAGRPAVEGGDPAWRVDRRADAI